MSIASEIIRINTNIANAYTSLDAKGATMPETQNSANLADTIDTIQTGGGGGGVSEDFDRSAFYAKIAEMDNILIVKSGEYNSDRMQRALQHGFIQKKRSSGDLDTSHFYILQLKYDTKCITFKPSGNDPISFWCPQECNVYTSDGLGRITNDSDTSDRRITIEFTGDEDRTIIIGTASGAYYNLTQSLFDVFDKLNGSYNMYDSNIRACHVYLSAYEKNDAPSTSTYGSLFNGYGFTRVLGASKIFSFDKPVNTWGRLSDDSSIQELNNFDNALEDTSIFAEIYDNNFFDANLSVFKMPSRFLSNLTSNLTRYSQVYSFGSENGLFPFIVDFSGYTSSSAISFGANTQLVSATSFGRKLTTIYIKLPTTANVNLVVYSGNSSNANDSLQLTYKSWQYLAENAPSVSGKTLRVGLQFYQLAKTLQVPSYKAITDALEAKGWTINQ